MTRTNYSERIQEILPDELKPSESEFKKSEDAVHNTRTKRIDEKDQSD